MLNHHDKPQNSVSGDEMLKHFNMDHTMLANPNVFPHKPKFDLVCRRPHGGKVPSHGAPEMRGTPSSQGEMAATVGVRR